MEAEEIARWLETLHCDRWKDDGVGCVKSNCELFRYLAEEIRKGSYKV